MVAVCDAAGQFIEWWGFRGIHGRVWTLLALRGRPLSQSDIAQLLGVSRSLISGAIAELSEYGLVRPRSEHRNAPYEAVMDVWPVISDVLRSREWMLIEQTRLALESAIEEAELAQAQGEVVPWNVHRMRLLMGMTDAAQAFLRLIVALRMPKAPKGVSGWVSRASTVIRSFRSIT